MSIKTITYGGYTINREEKTIDDTHPFHGNIHFKLIAYNFTTKNWTKYKHCPPEELDHYLPNGVLYVVMQQWPEDFKVEPRLPVSLPIPPMSEDAFTTLMADKLFNKDEDND